jgi:hypothetical protein
MNAIPQVKILRTIKEDKQTLGMLFIDNVFECFTLELPWKENQRVVSCIPAGDYEVVKRFSETYKNHFHVLNVPDRDWILIHHGNYFTNTRGCILVGQKLVDINGDGYRDVTDSVNTMKKLNSVLPKKFFLKIEESKSK